MKKISYKIILGIVLCSAVGLIINGGMNLFISTDIVKRHVIEELYDIAKIEKLKLQRELDVVERTVAILKGGLTSSFDMEQLEVEGYIEGFQRDYKPQLIGMARELKALNGYIFFNPDFYRGVQLAVVDLDWDGAYEEPDPFVLADVSEEELNSLEYSWYTDAVKEGEHWTEPYFWEPYNASLISYTKALFVDDVMLAVIGSDLAVDELINHFTKDAVFKNGNMFLLDSELTILIDKNFAGKSLKELDPYNYDKFKKVLKRGGTERSVEYNFRGQDRVLVYEVMENGWILCISIPQSEIWSELNRMRLLFVVFLVLVTALSGLVALFIARSISEPLKSITGGMERISTGDGDLTQKLDISSHDEVGLLAERFNIFLDKLKDIIDSAMQSASSDQAIVRELQRAVSDSAVAFNEIASSIGSIKGRLGSLDSNISDSTNSIEEVSANLSTINGQVANQGAAVAQSTAAIEEMIASLNNVVQVTNVKLRAIEQLVNTVNGGGEQLRVTNETFENGIVRRIGEITEMIKVINSISAQTNLLAMNASIEAAHAGESGRGFAVVAEEIRAMAETTSESARNISGIINQIVDSIKETAESAEKTSHAFVEIEQEVLDFKGAFQEIASSTSEISLGGNEVLQAVTELNRITTDILSGIMEIDRAAAQVKTAMLDIRQGSSESLKGMEEVSQGTGHVERSVNSVAEQTTKLAKETALLFDELNRFKT